MFQPLLEAQISSTMRFHPLGLGKVILPSSGREQWIGLAQTHTHEHKMVPVGCVCRQSVSLSVCSSVRKVCWFFCSSVPERVSHEAGVHVFSRMVHEDCVSSVPHSVCMLVCAQGVFVCLFFHSRNGVSQNWRSCFLKDRACRLCVVRLPVHLYARLSATSVCLSAFPSPRRRLTMLASMSFGRWWLEVVCRLSVSLSVCWSAHKVCWFVCSSIPMSFQR